MSSEKTSLASVHPFIQKFVFVILQNIRAKNLVREEKYVVHVDMVPKVSMKNFVPKKMEMQKYDLNKKHELGHDVKEGRGENVLEKGSDIGYKNFGVSSHLGGQRKNLMHHNIPSRKIMPQKNILPQRSVIPQKYIYQKPSVFPPKVKDVGLSQDYGKITSLLNDVSVSTIECLGAGRPLMVIRAGRRQTTRIVLNKKEIRDFLDKVSDAVHIPILEGVFRAYVDNFSVNAVISEIVGSRFVVKKANAYAMLDRG